MALFFIFVLAIFCSLRAVASGLPSCVVSAGKYLPEPIRQGAPILAAAACTGTLMYPLDVIRTLRMANAGSGLSLAELVKNFVEVHGVAGFFKQGIVPEVAKATYSRFLKFSMFPVLHASFNGGMVPALGSPKSKAIAALVASIPESLSIMPLEVAKIQLQMDTTKRFNNNMFKALGDVLNTRGVRGLSIGYTGIQLRQACWTVIYFSTVGSIQKKMEEVVNGLGFDTDSASVKPVCQLVSGFAAGVLGTCFNTPFDTIRSVLQKKAFAAGATGAVPTFAGVTRELVADKGAGILYSGFAVKAMHLGGGGALMALFVPMFTDIFKAMGETDQPRA